MREEDGAAGPGPINNSVLADWYPDPSGAKLVRWWDGNSWSEYTAEPGKYQKVGSFGEMYANLEGVKEWTGVVWYYPEGIFKRREVGVLSLVGGWLSLRTSELVFEVPVLEVTFQRAGSGFNKIAIEARGNRYTVGSGGIDKATISEEQRVLVAWVRRGMVAYISDKDELTTKKKRERGRLSRSKSDLVGVAVGVAAVAIIAAGLFVATEVAGGPVIGMGRSDPNKPPGEDYYKNAMETAEILCFMTVLQGAGAKMVVRK